MPTPRPGGRLRRVSARGFSLLRNIDLELGDGLTVLTGESGAGKTLLLDAVAFALGGRPNRSLLAEGAARCEVTLEIELGEDEVQALGAPWQSGRNTLARVLLPSGRSRLKLNGSPLTAGDAAAAGERLFEITGQFESRILFNPETHLGLLDAFGDQKLPPLLAKYHEAYAGWRQAAARLRALRESEGQREQEVSFLSFQVEELAKAEVAVGERAEVDAGLRLQLNAQALIEAAGGAAQLLDGDDDNPGAYDLAARAHERTGELERLLDGGEIEAVDSEELSARLAALLEGLRELAAQLRQVAGAIQHDPGEVERLQDRLDEILRLERKYDCPADELPVLLSEKQARLALLTDESQSPEALESQVRDGETQVRELAAQLTKKRSGAARQLEKSTLGYFKRLDFPHVALQVELTAAEQPGPQGQDQVELLISLNPGEPARPLARVASGGEASRLLLGIKAALADRLDHGALLLDEVEAGVGGDTARKVADVLVDLSATRQVLAITHLPGVAARGGLHLVARKQVAGGRSGVEFQAVSGQQRRKELARMLGEAGGAEEQALVDKLLGGA